MARALQQHKALFQQHLKDRLQDLDLSIDGVRDRINQADDDRTKVHLSERLGALQNRRDATERKLRTLEAEPDTAWTNFKAQIAEEWDNLVRDFKGRVDDLR